MVAVRVIVAAPKTVLRFDVAVMVAVLAVVCVDVVRLTSFVVSPCAKVI